MPQALGKHEDSYCSGLCCTLWTAKHAPCGQAGRGGRQGTGCVGLMQGEGDRVGVAGVDREGESVRDGVGVPLPEMAAPGSIVAWKGVAVPLPVALCDPVQLGLKVGVGVELPDAVASGDGDGDAVRLGDGRLADQNQKRCLCRACHASAGGVRH